MLIAGILDVILWIVLVFVVIGALIGVAAFLGLRRLWKFVAGAFESDGRPGPGDPPLSRGPRGSLPVPRPDEPEHVHVQGR